MHCLAWHGFTVAVCVFHSSHWSQCLVALPLCSHLCHAHCRPQALLRGVQLPADTYDRAHELRLYDKVAMTLNADIERNKLATFATVGERHGLQSYI
jgi:hypothetical protein